MTQTDLNVPRESGFLRKVWALTWPFFRSEHRGIAGLLLAVTVTFTLLLVGLDVAFNYWNRAFYNAVQNKDEPEFWRQMLVFSAIATATILFSVYNDYLKRMLLIRWRKWMTERLTERWLSGQTYYRLQFTAKPTDNPEQRIEQDIFLFIVNAIDMSFGLLASIVSFFSFITILWTISGPLSFTVSGQAITIPGYMVWVALIYAVGGSWLTYRIGRPLIATNFGLQESNATFRFGMTRVRENAESVAFYHGENPERRELDRKFDRIWHYWWDFMRQQRRLSWFLNGYNQIAIIFPFVVASPRYFSGAIELGILMQIASAFGNVQGALSWFVNNFGGDSERGLAPWKATIDRLTGFMDAMDRAETIKPGIVNAPATGTELTAENVDLVLPNGRALIRGLDAKIQAGDKLLISGPSGAGKTTLFRALAGIWPFGSGRLLKPNEATALFLPQRPYLPIGTLRNAVAYPARPDEIDPQATQAVLRDVNLEHLASRLDEEANWSHELSIGEQQRVAIARALLLKPDWLYLDEATSALDPPNEQRMYRLLAERLPNATVLSIAHRPEVARFHHRRLAIDPASTSAKIDAMAAE
jgi:putative ATP-binding cassette transporter